MFQCICEMKLFISLLIFGLLKAMNLEELQHVNQEYQNRDDLPIFVNSVEGNETSVEAAIGMTSKNSGLSPQDISELHDMVKDISHSKGIYRESNKLMSDDDLEIRRSILKKVAVASEADAIHSILQLIEADEKKLDLFDQMEFLVHQYDVAVSFATQGGFQVITPFLFSSDEKVAAAAASVLGAAMQSNPTVQKYALQHNVGNNLLELLSHKSPLVLARVIFALASLLRNAPEAQRKFFAANGISMLAEMLKNEQISTNTKLKIINLFSDLALEQQAIQFYSNGQNFDKLVELERLFVHEMQKWHICKLIPSFLNLEDFETHQKIVLAMASVHSICHKEFKKQNINNRLKKLIKVYDPDSDGEGAVYPSIDEDLKRALHGDLSSLLKKNKRENENKSTVEMLKDEF